MEFLLADSPEISTTQWRTVSDSKNLTYFFESSLTPDIFWVNLRDVNLSEGAPVLKLSIANGETVQWKYSKSLQGFSTVQISRCE